GLLWWRGRWTGDEVARDASRIAGALGAMHAHGVVNRDLKPGNIMVVEGELDRLKVLDLGIAWLTKGSQTLTYAGASVGTPAYMSPEQVRGARDIDGRADLFSLGCVMFECLAGHPPFVSEDMLGVLTKILLEEPRRIRDACADVPPAIEQL